MTEEGEHIQEGQKVGEKPTYEKPKLTKHDELTQVTFSTHEPQRPTHSYSRRQEVLDAKEDTRRRENTARGIPND